MEICRLIQRLLVG